MEATLCAEIKIKNNLVEIIKLSVKAVPTGFEPAERNWVIVVFDVQIR